MNGLAWSLVALTAVAVLAYLARLYNGFIALNNNISKAWANVDVLLKQRHDEIPKLVAVCEGYMAHERLVLDRVAKAREAMMAVAGQPARLGGVEGELQAALRQLFAVAENYPDLKAQASFQQLQNRISAVEMDLADRREFYNDSVNRFNIRIATIPDVLLARALRLTPSEMFHVPDTEKADLAIRFRTS